MLALSFARAAREFFCHMSQCWRIFWVTGHSQLTDETGETATCYCVQDAPTSGPAGLQLGPRQAALHPWFWALAQALRHSRRQPPLAQRVEPAAHTEELHRYLPRRRPAAGSRAHDRAGLPTRSSHTSSTALGAGHGAPHLDFRDQRDEARRFCASTVPSHFCARASPSKRVPAPQGATLSAPRRGENFEHSAPKANFACENAGWRRTFKAGVEGGQAGRRHRDEP